MLNFAILLVYFAAVALSLDLLEIKKSGEDREPEPELGKQTGDRQVESLEFGETLLTIYRLDNNSLFEKASSLSERAGTLELKYKNRNSLDITKAFYNQIEDAKKKRSILSLLYIDLQQEKETELLGFIQDFNSISLIHSLQSYNSFTFSARQLIESFNFFSNSTI